MQFPTANARLILGPNNNHLVTAIASTPLNPLAHAQVEHLAMRTKVFETAISSSKTVSKYFLGPSASSGDNELDWEENEPHFDEPLFEMGKGLEVEKLRNIVPHSAWEGVLK